MSKTIAALSSSMKNATATVAVGHQRPAVHNVAVASNNAADDDDMSSFAFAFSGGGIRSMSICAGTFLEYVASRTCDPANTPRLTSISSNSGGSFLSTSLIHWWRVHHTVGVGISRWHKYFVANMRRNVGFVIGANETMKDNGVTKDDDAIASSVESDVDSALFTKPYSRSYIGCHATIDAISLMLHLLLLFVLPLLVFIPSAFPFAVAFDSIFGASLRGDTVPSDPTSTAAAGTTLSSFVVTIIGLSVGVGVLLILSWIVLPLIETWYMDRIAKSTSPSAAYDRNSALIVFHRLIDAASAFSLVGLFILTTFVLVRFGHQMLGVTAFGSANILLILFVIRFIISHIQERRRAHVVGDHHDHSSLKASDIISTMAEQFVVIIMMIGCCWYYAEITKWIVYRLGGGGLSSATSASSSAIQDEPIHFFTYDLHYHSFYNSSTPFVIPLDLSIQPISLYAGHGELVVGIMFVLAFLSLPIYLARNRYLNWWWLTIQRGAFYYKTNACGCGTDGTCVMDREETQQEEEQECKREDEAEHRRKEAKAATAAGATASEVEMVAVSPRVVDDHDQDADLVARHRRHIRRTIPHHHLDWYHRLHRSLSLYFSSSSKAESKSDSTPGHTRARSASVADSSSAASAPSAPSESSEKVDQERSVSSWHHPFQQRRWRAYLNDRVELMQGWLPEDVDRKTRKDEDKARSKNGNVQMSNVKVVPMTPIAASSASPALAIVVSPPTSASASLASRPSGGLTIDSDPIPSLHVCATQCEWTPDESNLSKNWEQIIFSQSDVTRMPTGVGGSGQGAIVLGVLSRDQESGQDQGSDGLRSRKNGNDGTKSGSQFLAFPSSPSSSSSSSASISSSPPSSPPAWLGSPLHLSTIMSISSAAVSNGMGADGVTSTVGSGTLRNMFGLNFGRELFRTGIQAQDELELDERKKLNTSEILDTIGTAAAGAPHILAHMVIVAMAILMVFFPSASGTPYALSSLSLLWLFLLTLQLVLLVILPVDYLNVYPLLRMMRMFLSLRARQVEPPQCLLLSDGGQSENHALLPQWIKREKVIIAVDGSGDPTEACGGFLAALQQGRTKFGLRFTLVDELSDGDGVTTNEDLQPLIDSPPPPLADYPHISHPLTLTLHVHYPARGAELPFVGLLIYLKCRTYVADDHPTKSLNGCCCICCHSSSSCCRFMQKYVNPFNGSFPQHSTGNQFFTQRQHESYREMGRLAMRQAKAVWAKEKVMRQREGMKRKDDDANSNKKRVEVKRAGSE